MPTFTILDDQALTTRACRAYERRCSSNGWVYGQPSGGGELVKLDDKMYVVLSNARGMLGVYAVSADDKLTWLEEWPDELNDI